MHLTSANLKIQPVKRDHAAIPLGQPRSTQHQARALPGRTGPGAWPIKSRHATSRIAVAHDATVRSGLSTCAGSRAASLPPNRLPGLAAARRRYPPGAG